MDNCGIIGNVFAGLITGAISSYWVSYCFQKKEDQRAYQRYKVLLEQYLYSLFDLLVFIERGNDCSALLTRLATKPFDEWREYYEDEEQQIIKEIEELEEELLLFGHSYDVKDGRWAENDVDLNTWENTIPKLAERVHKMKYPKKKWSLFFHRK